MGSQLAFKLWACGNSESLFILYKIQVLNKEIEGKKIKEYQQFHALEQLIYWYTLFHKYGQQLMRKTTDLFCLELNPT